jgi:hypothetical protein
MPKIRALLENDMPDWIMELLSVHGPLALGWVVAAILWRQAAKREVKLTDTLIGNTEALTLLATRLER